MNDDQIRKLCSKWQTRLKLDHWDVTLELYEDLGNNAASITHDYKYLNANIKLLKNRSKKELANSIIHELLHLHLAGLNVVLESSEDMAQEQAIQILSRVILEGYEGK